MNQRSPWLKISKLITLFFCLLSTIHLYAQPGWDFIRQNDYKKAAENFKDELEKDSTNINALEGMIFLSETSGDQRSYNKYINTFVKNHWDENYFLLFESELTEENKKLLEKNNASERLKIEQKLTKADELYKKRKFNESFIQYGEVFGNYNWTYIGPFKNINGSGHIVKFPLESENYDTSKIYADENGDELKWVDPPNRNRKSMVSFKNNLKHSYSTSVYFANTFIELPEKRKVQLRITRGSPMKIWVDDYLVFDNNENTSYEWDNEIVELEMSQGIHRILVKYSELTKRKNNYSYHDYRNNFLKGNSNKHNNSSFYQYEHFKSDYSDNHYDGDFEIRLTDQEGKILKNIKSYSKTTYTSAQYSPELKSLFVINYLKSKIQQDPENYFNRYALLKAYEKYQFELNGEESIIKFYRGKKDLVFAKYLAYKIYFANGKREKAYEVLNDINHTNTPIFDILFQKFEEIDDVNDEEKYLEALNNLKNISPSNLEVISEYLDYYDKKDMTDEKESFIKKMIKEYPDYEPQLKSELKKNLDEKKQLQKDLNKNKEDFSYKKSVKVLKKDVRQSFSPEDYIELISHYESRDEFDKTISLFDELIKTEPYESKYYLKKADFLFEQEKYDMALEELNKGLKLRPFDSQFYENMGDVYHEKKEKDKALKCYKTAKKLSGNEGSYRSKGSLNEKIEKIEGQKQLKKIFKTPTFQDILAKENEWKEKYKEEESVVLMYTRDVVIDSGNHGEAFDKIMIKILNDGGIKKWLEYDFNFLGEIKSAKIIKKSGAEVIPEGRGGYKVFKNLEPGDIIQIEGGFQFDVTKGIDESNYFHTYLSFEAPVYYTKFEVAVSEGRYLGYLHHKVEDNLKKSKDKGYDFYKWEYYNMPKITNEDASIDKFDYYSSIMISTVPDWTKIASWYDRITYKKLKSNYEVKEILDSIIKPGMTDVQKVEKIYNYLTREIKYSYVPFLQSGYVPKDPGLTVCSRIGDCKDVATLMVTMLREVGIESYYVLVKTNDYFHEKMLPSVYFNHVIAGYYLDGRLRFSDMTTDFYPYYILPEMDANAWALLIKENGGELFQLPKDNIDAAKNKTEVSVNAEFNLDRSADLKVNAIHRGITGGNIREKFAQSNKEEQKNYIMDIMGKGIFENVELSNYQFYNIPDISTPLKSDYTFNIFNYCDRVSGMLVFRIPYMTPITAHPAILSKTRYNSLDLRDIVNIEPTVQKMTLMFPEGYDLLEMPKDISVQNKYGTYKVTYKKIKGGLYAEKTQSFNYAVIDVKEFEAFKKFYLELLDIDSSKIALRKK